MRQWIAKILRDIANKVDPPRQSGGEQNEAVMLPVGESSDIYPAGQGYLNPFSPTWVFIRNWANERLEKSRGTNDSINCDATKTAALRGEIKVLKDLIALPIPKKGLLDIESYQREI